MLRLFWFFHVEAALFAAADAAMRPQPFQNHLRGGSGRTSVFAIVSAKPGDVLHQTLNLAKLLAALGGRRKFGQRSEEHTSELQSLRHLVCRLLLEKKKTLGLTTCTRGI